MLHMDVGANARKRTPLTSALAAQLRAERAAAGMTQTELARQAGMSRVQLARIEGDERTLDIAQAADLSKALGISLVEFVQRAEARLSKEAKPAKPRKVSGG